MKKIMFLLFLYSCFAIGQKKELLNKSLESTCPPYSDFKGDKNYSTTTPNAFGGECSASVVPPTTLNGINITESFTGSVSTYSLSAYTSCGVTTPINSKHLGQSGSFSYTLNFSQPVNNLVLALTATGHTYDEIFTFTTNSGTPVITGSTSCYSVIVANTIYSGLGAQMNVGGGGGRFTITAPNNFTSMNISGPGGQAGSLLSVCANSIINMNCNSGTDAPLLSIATLHSLCNIDMVNLNSISSSNTPPTVGVSLMWFTSATPIIANMLTTVQATSQPAGPIYYAAFFDSINNCYSNTTPVNTLLNQPIIPIFNEINPICSGAAIDPLPLTSDNNIVGSWTPSINNEQSTTYTFIPNTGECATSTSLTIEVIQTPDVSITSNCIGLSFELTAVVTSSDNVSFNWYNSQNELIGNTPSIIITTTGNYKVIVTNLNCSEIATSTIGNIFCEIQKGISPNNDGDNDFFDLQLFEAKNLDIYSRYGMKIYSQNNYTNQWVGQSDKGDELPDGTYYYVIERINGEFKTGWIYLNREY